MRLTADTCECFRALVTSTSLAPYFVSLGRSYQVKLGTGVTFHCEVSE